MILRARRRKGGREARREGGREEGIHWSPLTDVKERIYSVKKKKENERKKHSSCLSVGTISLVTN